MLHIILLFTIFLCWGSFLNVLAYRITFDKPFFTKRSICPACGNVIAWYDNIPVLSWLLLKGRCRACKTPITILYPFIELLSGFLFTGLFFWVVSVGEFVSYFIFFSALIASVRTDLEAMMIPQLFSIWLAPVGVLLSFLGMTGVGGVESMFGATLGYGVLWAVAKVFKHVTKKDGLGVGDMELMAMIGAFLGPLGGWLALLVGCVSGLLVGGGYLLLTKQSRYTRIPFGPFLALGAMLYFFFEDCVLLFLFG